MIIDCHQHFWKFDSTRHAWIDDDMKLLRKDFLPADFELIMKRNNITGTVAIQAEQSDAETDFLLTLAAHNTFIKGVVGWIDLRAKDVEDRLARLCENKLLKGIRHIVQSEPEGFLGSTDFIHGVNLLSRYGLTYDLLIYHHQIPEALAFAAKTENVRIVLDHIAKPSIRTGEKTHWELNLAALATFGNIHCKLSGLVTEADWENWTYEKIEPFIDEVFESFGSDRIMYGSDWPVCLLAGSYEDQFDLVQRYISGLTETEKQKVLGDNAKRFYNL